MKNEFMKILLCILSFVATMVLGSGLLLADSQLKVGVISPLSGPYAHFGEAARVGIKLAEAELEPGKIQFIYEDSQFEPKEALNAAIKLVESDKVNVLIVLGTPTSNAVLPYSLKHNIPTIIWSASADLSKQYKHSIRIMSTGFEQGDLLAKEAKARGYQKVALILSENAFSKAIMEGVKSSDSKLGIVSEVTLPPTQMDFNLEIIKLKHLNVDAIGVCLNTGQVPTYIKQLRALKYEGAIFGCNAISSPEVLKALEDYKYKAWSSEGVVDKDFARKFEARYPDTSGLWEAAGYYDAVMYLVKYGKDQLVGKYLNDSALGRSFIKEDENGKHFEYKLGITEMDDGRFVRE